MALIRYSLFSGFDCRTLNDDVIMFPTRKVRALAAYLTVNLGNAQTRDRLAQLLWDDGTESQLRANLLSRLR
jgi:DNA-binding SARP family transcriptional activator